MYCGLQLWKYLIRGERENEREGESMKTNEQLNKGQNVAFYGKDDDKDTCTHKGHIDHRISFLKVPGHMTLLGVDQVHLAFEIT